MNHHTVLNAFGRAVSEVDEVIHLGQYYEYQIIAVITQDRLLHFVWRAKGKVKNYIISHGFEFLGMTDSNKPNSGEARRIHSGGVDHSGNSYGQKSDLATTKGGVQLAQNGLVIPLRDYKGDVRLSLRASTGAGQYYIISIANR